MSKDNDPLKDLHWLKTKVWAYPVLVHHRQSAFDPLTYAIHSLKTLKGLSETDEIDEAYFADHFGLPLGMIRMAHASLQKQKERESLEYNIEHGWVFWDPYMDDIIPSVLLTSELEKIDIPEDSIKIKKPRKDILLRRVQAIQNSHFLKLISCGETHDGDLVSKIELQSGGKGQVYALDLPIEFRGRDIMCWNPQVHQTQHPQRALSIIDKRERYIIEKDRFLSLKADYESMFLKPILKMMNFETLPELEEQVKMWCQDELGNYWNPSWPICSEDIVRAKTSEHLSHFCEEDWKRLGQPWGLVLEQTMIRLTEGFDKKEFKDTKKLLYNLTHIKSVSSEMYKIFSKKNQEKTVSEFLNKLHENRRHQNLTIFEYRALFCVMCALDSERLAKFKSIKSRFEDQNKLKLNAIWNKAQADRNICMHQKSEDKIVDIDIFRSNVLMICKVYIDLAYDPVNNGV